MTGGFWAERLRTNRERTLPHAFEQLVEAGNLENFRLAAGTATGRYRALGIMFDGPFPFLDSDVYKWLEGVGWELGRAWDDGIARDGRPGDRRSSRRRSATTATSTRSSRSWRRAREYRDLQCGHELYCIGHLVQAAVAWHRALGDDRLLAVARAGGRLRRRGPGPGRRATASTAIPRSRWRSSSCTGSTGEAPLPRARPAPHRPSRPRPAGVRTVRRRRTGRTRAGPRGARRGRPRGAPAVPRRGRGRRRRRDRRRRAARRGPRALAGHGRDPDLPDRRARQPPRAGGVRRPVRAAARPRLHRDLRGDRRA